jgi:DNA-binding response OmpR family regulator
MTNKKRALIVDDSRTSLLVESSILRRSNFDVVTASDGDEAVAKAVALIPDIIVMDVVMPRLDGFSACRQLRSDPRTSGIPIILVTTRGEEEHVTTGYLSGCSDYITKPVDSLELVEKVRNLVEAAAC